MPGSPAAASASLARLMNETPERRVVAAASTRARALQKPVADNEHQELPVVSP